jgi:hypothetical protein
MYSHFLPRKWYKKEQKTILENCFSGDYHDKFCSLFVTKTIALIEQTSASSPADKGFTPNNISPPFTFTSKQHPIVDKPYFLT